MFDIARFRRVRRQKERMLFLSSNIVQYTTRANSREGIRRYHNAARLQYGHKNKPTKI